LKNKNYYFNTFLFDTNVHLSLGAFAITYLTYYLIGIKNEIHVPVFVLFSTLIAYNTRNYNFNIFKLFALDKKFWFAKNIENLGSFVFLVSSFCLLLLVFIFPFKNIYFFIPFGILVLFYSKSNLILNADASKLKPLREIPYLKFFLITFTWCFATAIFPILDYSFQHCIKPSDFHNFINTKNLLLVLERFIFVGSIALLFDIKDVKNDPPSMKTIPQVLGVKLSFKLVILMIVIASLLNYLELLFGVTNSRQFLAYLICSTITTILCALSYKSQNKNYFILLELAILLQAILVVSAF
jgi:4-hydroxybenzoate polyprenyltransferase